MNLLLTVILKVNDNFFVAIITIAISTAIGWTIFITNSVFSIKKDIAVIMEILKKNSIYANIRGEKASGGSK